MSAGVEVRLGLGDRDRVEDVVVSRNSSQTGEWRPRIVLVGADGVETREIRRRSRKGKSTIWH
jgi:hypothetical protein